MQTITREIIDIIGKQIEPRSTAMNAHELDTFENMCTNIAQSESAAIAVIEKTKIAGVLRDAYEVAVANGRNDEAAIILDKLMSLV